MHPNEVDFLLECDDILIRHQRFEGKTVIRHPLASNTTQRRSPSLRWLYPPIDPKAILFSRRLVC